MNRVRPLRSAPRPPVPAGLPDGFGLVLDPGCRWYPGGLLFGGSPERLYRLGPRGQRLVRAWADGVLPRGAAQLRLARSLVVAGLAHPRPGPGLIGPEQVTVVIPVRDRPRELRRCLLALRGLPHIVVVDDGSHDPAATRRAAEGTGAHVLVHSVSRGPGSARNTGLRAVRTPFVAFVDSDCVPRPGWLDALLPHLADPAVAAVAPRIEGLDRGPGLLARYESACAPLDLGPRPARVAPRSRVPLVPTAALVVRRAALGGGFDESLLIGEDVDLVWRMCAAGWQIRYEPAARVAHDHRTRPFAWVRRRFEYGTSAAPLALRHPGLLAPVELPPRLAAFWLLLAAGRLLPATAALTAPRPGRPGSASGTPVPARLLGRLVGTGVVRTGHALSRAVWRTWLPVAAVGACRSRRARGALAGTALVSVGSAWWRAGRPAFPARFALTSAVDDVAYCAGVWWGCLRHRTVRPLLPVIGRSRGR
ncbi:mycofactocin biosynthesis glycosyltransferase MftF [Streptomyces sp. NBC_00582]|uniref:mycofactocin biosynthesis glycosyltransferase MftF n=1 Tax=Streptomyces sp. NBC_00582 TaxID=2975783 RepID=UPI0010642272|nr:mycofactocin biosynthesis glycosyltransferase MftF [Streptomyces sp. NBC_00582]WUB59218.1 mycofactocin biosynthesis glycosyltransferase MftF [Streptomyces sp. NBC_00582]